MRVVCIALLSGLCTFPQYAAPKSAQITRDFTNLPLYFEKNQGQVDTQALYIGRNGNVTTFLRADGLTMAARGHAVSMRFLGAGKDAQFSAENPVDGVTNYYGAGRAITGVAHYGRVRVNNVRPGINVVYYGNGKEIEYDMAIHPGADPRDIRIRFDGAERPVVDENGDVILKTAWGELRQRRPRVWQDVAGHRVPVECSYTINRSGEVRLALAGYRKSAELVIDPILSVSTYLGGNGDDEPLGIAVDTSGYIYITGYTYSSNFPVTNGSTNECCNDVFVTRMNPLGTALAYSTYISVGNSQANAIAVDKAGNAYITGSTYLNTFPKTFGQFGGGQDVFVVKMGSAGNIVYSTILGGSASDIGYGIAVDAGGAAYVAGSTQSTNFSRTGTPMRTTLGGDSDAFIAKLQPSGQVSYAINFGGGSSETANAVAIDASGNAYVAGFTTSNDFPATAGAYSTTLRGSQNAFISVVNPIGSAFVYSTFLGGTQSDAATGIAVDAAGAAFVTGTTTSNDFPVLNAFTPTRPNPVRGFSDTGFVTKLNPTGSALVYSSFLGGSYSDWPVGIGVDSGGAAYVVGTANSSDFPTTPGALKRSKASNYTIDNDIYLVQVAPDGTALSYSTLLGGSGLTNARAMAIDASQGVYIAGITSSSTLPTTLGAFEPTNPKAAGYTVDTGFVAKIDMSSPTLCNAAATPSSSSIPGYGGSFSFNLMLAAGCPWEAVADSFITLTTAVRGMGSAVAIPVSGIVALNNDTNNARTGSIKIGDATFTVNQSAGSCADPVFNPGAASFDTNGGIRSISLTLPAPCSWTAVSSASWLSITANPSGMGSGTITIYAPPNSFSQRTGTLTIAGKTVTVTQSGAACTATAVSSNTSFNSGGGTGVIRITTSPQGCGWNANTGVPWIQLASNVSGQGAGAIPFLVAANPGTAPRSGQILVADQLITIQQSGGPFGTVSSYTLSIFAGGAFNSSPSLGDGGPATAAYLQSPNGLLFDPSTQNVYIADLNDNRVRVVTPDGIINTFAGGGSSNADNIAPTAASLMFPGGLAIDNAGAIYVSENSRVRKITPGVITTIAGGLTPGSTGDNGPATSALLNRPFGLAIDSTGTLYIADSSNNRIRRVSGGTITTFCRRRQRQCAGRQRTGNQCNTLLSRGSGVGCRGQPPGVRLGKRPYPQDLTRNNHYGRGRRKR